MLVLFMKKPTLDRCLWLHSGLNYGKMCNLGKPNCLLQRLKEINVFCNFFGRSPAVRKEENCSKCFILSLLQSVLAHGYSNIVYSLQTLFIALFPFLSPLLLLYFTEVHCTQTNRPYKQIRHSEETAHNFFSSDDNCQKVNSSCANCQHDYA